jgi:tetratricopeptide (TPR) repeat protein
MKRKTVSLCMIARNEEASIGRAIKSVLALVDEIIVVDTGSSDNTRIIAEGYGARVLDHRWHDDFSAARNAGLEAATSDWILVLDCDEHLQSIRPLVFQRLLSEPTAAGYRVQMTGYHVDERLAVDTRLRLFRNHPDVRYCYPVHEQITPRLQQYATMGDMMIQDSPLVVVHDPGGSDQISRKRDRNLRLLRQIVGVKTGEPYFSAMLGSETLCWLDEEVLPTAGLTASLEHLVQAWKQIMDWPVHQQQDVTYGLPLAVDLAAALLAVKRFQEAAQVVETARNRWHDSARLRVQGVRAQLACMAMNRDPVQVKAMRARVCRELEALDALLDAEPPEAERSRLLSALAMRYSGELALIERDITTAAESFEKSLTINQDCSSAWVGLAECARHAGDRKRSLRLYLRAVTASEWNLQAWERGTSLMEELGFHDNARSWRAEAQERFPERTVAVTSPEG